MAREPLRVVINQAARDLDEAGVASPQADAEILAAWSLGVRRTALALTPLVDSTWADGYRDLIARRAGRIPLQHLTGEATLARATVRVGPGVFIPRPETESMIEWAVAAIADLAGPVVIDLCAGSAAIALAVATARPDSRVIAVELDPAALAWARRNVDEHVAAGGTAVDLRAADVTDATALGGVLADLAGGADLVIANPPYVPAGTPVDPEVADHDPPQAVFAGADGLAVINPMITVAAGLLRPGGFLAIEHDDTHGQQVPQLFAGRSLFDDVADHPDLAGRPRFVTARRAGSPR